MKKQHPLDSPSTPSLRPSELFIFLILLFVFCLFIGRTTIDFSEGEFYMEHYIISPLFAIMGVVFIFRVRIE